MIIRNMPKGGRKGDKKNNIVTTSDIKLSDFANCSVRTGRLRKSAGNSLDKEVEDIRSSEALWFEKDLDEFQFPEPSNETRKKHTRSKLNTQDILNRPGVCYPVDVWFLIGQFVKPEDVKIFASICKDSYFVSRTYSFWLKMYKRHYQKEAHLPQRLQPECIEGSFCLKMYVIRALYHMYPHFTNQLSTHMSSSDVYSLSNLCCTSMWRMQKNGKWLFHFKFQAPIGSDTPVSYGIAIQDLWTSHDTEEEKNREMYVNHNPDEGCKILQISSSHFVAVPPFVMGSRLSDVRINLAHDMRRQKLQLMFCYSNYRLPYKTASCKESGGYGDIVEFDPAENITVLNWWHPQYPSGCKV